MDSNSQETPSGSQLTTTHKINQYRKFVSIALQSAKIYVDMGGDACGVDVLGALFRWPDVIYDLLNVIEGKEKAEEEFIADVGRIMIDPIAAMGTALLERVDIPKEEYSAYKTILTKRTANTMGEIAAHKDLMVNILVKLSALKEKQDEDRNRRSG